MTVFFQLATAAEDDDDDDDEDDEDDGESDASDSEDENDVDDIDMKNNEEEGFGLKSLLEEDANKQSQVNGPQGVAANNLYDLITFFG